MAKKKTAKKKQEVKPENDKATTFPKIATTALIQSVTFDAGKGADVKFKGMSFSPHQCEHLMRMCDGNEPVRLTIEETAPQLPFTDPAEEPLLNGGAEAQKAAKNAKPKRTVGELTDQERAAAKDAQAALLGKKK